MATFTHEVSPYRRKDGTYLIKIRINHNRKTLRKPTGIYATAEQLTRDRTRIRDAALIDAVDKAVERVRMAAARVDGAEFMDVAQLWQAITARLEAQHGFRLDLRAFSDTLTAKMEKGTADGYKYALRSLFAYLGWDEVDINEIDKAMVQGFRDWLEARNGKGCRAASAYLEKLRHIHARARDIYNDDDTGLVRIPRQPFKGMIPRQPASRHRDLTLDELRRVMAVTPATERMRVALDAFRLSFCLAGMNTADLYRLRKSDLRDGVLTYNRAKTDSRRDDKALMMIRVEREAADMIARLKGSKALLYFADRYAGFPTFNQICNKGLKRVGALAGVPGLTTYHARHTWATLARNECGIPRDVVDEALNHVQRGGRVTDIYIRRDFTRVWDANRKVLDLVFGK